MTAGTALLLPGQAILAGLAFAVADYDRAREGIAPGLLGAASLLVLALACAVAAAVPAAWLAHWETDPRAARLAGQVTGGGLGGLVVAHGLLTAAAPLPGLLAALVVPVAVLTGSRLGAGAGARRARPAAETEEGAS